ncbi:hypothetical protein F2Q68_00019662 [Brassica cretica]|uniref:Uncharacterized protein n=1 Tax=Brassica cretica TaxID=69181 RepID=A0A8S9G566_BRACR|nr:hypothetical protein F2Q68_00019662 [Brassica cretica]
MIESSAYEQVEVPNELLSLVASSQTMGTRRGSSKVVAEGEDRGNTEEAADRRRRGSDALHSGELPRRN